MSSFTPPAALPPGKIPRYPLNTTLGRGPPVPKIGTDASWRRKSLLSCGKSRTDWQVVTDVSGQPTDPIFKGQALKDCLTLEYGTDRFYRTSLNNCQSTHHNNTKIRISFIPQRKPAKTRVHSLFHSEFSGRIRAVAYRGGVWGVQHPPPKFRRPSKIVPNSTRL